MRDLLIVGRGGFGRETAEAARAAGWGMIAYLDDNPGPGIIGSPERVGYFPDPSVVICTGRQSTRPLLAGRLALPARRYATIIHPQASVPASCQIGPGSVLLAGVVLTADVTIGSHVAVMPHVTFTHDDVIEDYATFASGACLGGGVRIGRDAYIGTGALIREGVTVGAGALVGMGAVVLKDVPDRQVWAGVPARYLREVEQHVS